MPVRMTPENLKDAFDKLKTLRGDPPYDGGSNICRGDGYFAASIVTRFGMSIAELEKVTGYDKKKRRYEKALEKAAKIMEWE